jgi:RNA recognition motif-containing protein
MATNIYVGNLPFSTDSTEYGSVDRAQVISDRETGRSRGFGFVEMSDDNEAQTAIEALNGKEVDGRQLRVNVARERSR